jgi:hypothetical protein
MRRPRIEDLALARELAELAILDLALDVSARVLRFEHPTAAELPEPTDPPTLNLARELLQRIRGLRAELRRYRIAIDKSRKQVDDYPF